MHRSAPGEGAKTTDGEGAPPNLADARIEQAVADQERRIQARFEEEFKQRMESEIASARSQAEQRGFAEGLAKGEEFGRQSVAEQLERFSALAAALSQTKRTLLDDAEDAVVEIAYTALCRIVGANAFAREAVAGIVAEAMRDVGKSDELTIYLHPQDLTLLRPADTIHADGSLQPHWRLAADATLQFGGCRVASGNGALDARLEMQLATVRDTLLAVRASRQGCEES